MVDSTRVAAAAAGPAGFRSSLARLVPMERHRGLAGESWQCLPRNRDFPGP